MFNGLNAHGLTTKRLCMTQNNCVQLNKLVFVSYF